MLRRSWSPLVLAVAVLLATVSPVVAPATAAPAPPPDPDEDAIGWENGYWHNDSIDVDQSDGLTDRELEAVVSRTMARVEHIRELEFENDVPVQIISRAAYQERQANRSVGETLRTFDNAKFEALFLINDSTDSIEVQNENTGTSVLGFYSSTRGAIVLVSDNQSTLQVTERTLAHELVHALQDQHFNLSRYAAGTRDAANAESGFIEGDASYVDYQYSNACEDIWEDTCLAPTDADVGVGGGLANIGVYLLQYQPYSDGPNFVRSVHDRGGWTAVNDLYEQPPASAEQIIHPEKYRRDDPAEVRLPDRTTSNWERVRPDVRADYAELGESALATMLVYPLYHSGGQTAIIPASQFLNEADGGGLNEFDPLNYESRYSAGWDGDRLHVYRNEANETAYVWRLVWDTPRDAREFATGYQQLLDYWGAERVGPNTVRIAENGFDGAFHVVVNERTVTVVKAPTVEQLAEVRTTITVGTPPDTTTTTDGPETPTLSPVGNSSPDARTHGSTPTTGTSSSDTPFFPPGSTPGQTGFGLSMALAAVVLALLWRQRRG